MNPILAFRSHMAGWTIVSTIPAMLSQTPYFEHASFALVVTSWHRWPLGLRGTVGQRNIAKLSMSHHTAGPQACAA